jgi:hypothetical protein
LFACSLYVEHQITATTMTRPPKLVVGFTVSTGKGEKPDRWCGKKATTRIQKRQDLCVKKRQINIGEIREAAEARVTRYPCLGRRQKVVRKNFRHFALISMVVVV